MAHAPMAWEQRYPLILPKWQITFLLIREAHLRLSHARVLTILTDLRKEYCLIGGRKVAKCIVKACVTCQTQDARACSQVTPPLPKERVTRVHPFQVTGVDYAGPLYIKHSRDKFYILLFTCTVYRAVHLEITNSLDLANLILNFRKFMARRGVPSLIYPDCG